MNIINKILFILIAIIYMGCEEESAGSSTNPSQPDIGYGEEGNVDDYFYNFNNGETPYINSKFNRYSGLSILSPLSFDEDSDTLNFSSATDFILSFNLEDGDYDDWDHLVIDGNNNGEYDWYCDGGDDDSDEFITENECEDNGYTWTQDTFVENILTSEMMELSVFDEVGDDGSGSVVCAIGHCEYTDASLNGLVDEASTSYRDCCLNNNWFECDNAQYSTLNQCVSNCATPTECERGASAVYETEYNEGTDIWEQSCIGASTQWIPDLTFDSNQNGFYEYNEWVDLDGDGDTWDDCPDLNYDQQLTYGQRQDIYRKEEVLFSHTYGDIYKLEWNEDNERYMPVSLPGTCGQLTHTEYIGDSNDIGNPNVYPDTVIDTDVTASECLCLGGTFHEAESICLFSLDQCDSINGSLEVTNNIESEDYGVCTLQAEVYENVYDSTVYITQINPQDVYGFFNYEDLNGNGSWDDAEEWDDNSLDDPEASGNGEYDEGEDFVDSNNNLQFDPAEPLGGDGEDFEVGSSAYGQFYFDQTELTRSDSVHTSQVMTFEHTFRYPRKIVNTDSLMYKVSTDCDDDGQWDRSEYRSDVDNYTQEECSDLDGVWLSSSDFNFCDTGNGRWDPSEPFFNFDGDSSDDLNEGGDPDEHFWYNAGDSFLDRNCDELWNRAEYRSDVDNYTEDDCNDIGGVWMVSEEFSFNFCDIGNGRWDDAEGYTQSNGEFTDSPSEDCGSCTGGYLFEMSDRAKTLMVDYDTDPSSGEISWTAYEEVLEDLVINQRWSSQEFKLIETFLQETTKSKEVVQIDSMTAIYSYNFVENTMIDETHDYSITKTVWYEVDEGRQAAYHLYRKDPTNQNIIKLTHASYFILPGTNASELDGSEYSDYLVFDEFPSEETFLYTYGGLLRDGEEHSQSSTVYSPQTLCEYNIHETYKVSYEPAEMSYGNELYDAYCQDHVEDFTTQDACEDAGHFWTTEDFEDEMNGAYDGAYCQGHADEFTAQDTCENAGHIWIIGESFSDVNGNLQYDQYCLDSTSQDWNSNFLAQTYCELAGHTWVPEEFVDGNGIWEEGEEFTDGPVYLDECFKITRTKTTVMLGSGLEIVEENNTWLQNGRGIVKDEVSFRFNQNPEDPSLGDDFDGFYRLEIKDCRHCSQSGMYRGTSNGIFDNATPINFNQFNTIDDYNDEYKKIRTYGIQQTPINLNGSN